MARDFTQVFGYTLHAKDRPIRTARMHFIGPKTHLVVVRDAELVHQLVRRLADLRRGGKAAKR